ncbi:MAG: DNA adenine methylase [Phenylobacterium sp.]
MKDYSPIEIDFNKNECAETFDSKILFICNQIKTLKNAYVGNKSKLLYEIFAFLKYNNIQYNNVLDLFSGSAYVSLAMKMFGKNVVSNDILASSYLYAKAFVENNSIELTQDEKKYLLTNTSICESAFVSNNFNDRFTVNECFFLDRFYDNVQSIFKHDKDKQALAFSSLFIFILNYAFVGGRLNNGQVLAKLDHRLSHSRNKGYEIPFAKLFWYYFKSSGTGKAYNMDAIDFLRNMKNKVNKIDLVYLDPPYGGGQSDYAKMYNFFEQYLKQSDTLLNDNQLARFAKKKDYEFSFDLLLFELDKWDVDTWLLSYNDSSWASLDKIIQKVEKYKKVIVRDVQYHYKYRDKENAAGSEYLILADRR